METPRFPSREHRVVISSIQSQSSRTRSSALAHLAGKAVSDETLLRSA